MLLSKRREIWVDRSSSGVTYPLEEPLVKIAPGSRKLGTHQTSDGWEGLLASQPKPRSRAMLSPIPVPQKKLDV